MHQQEKPDIDHYRRGNSALKAGKAHEAESHYEFALKLNPGDHFAWNNLAVARRRQGCFQEALTALDKALTLKPDFFPAIINKGHIYRENLNDPEQAVEYYTRARAVQEDNPKAWMYLGLAHQDMENYALARQCYAHALTLKDCPGAVYFHRGHAALLEEDYPAAVDDYDIFLTFEPNHVAAWSNRGIALKELKKYEQAEQSFQRALEINPRYTSAYFNLSNLLLETGDYERAAANLEKLIEIDPHYLAAYINLGAALKEINQPESAIKWYDKALAIDPTYSKAHFQKGNRLHALKKHEEAEAAYRTALQHNPRDASAASNAFLVTGWMADWRHWYADEESLKGFVDQGIGGVAPFTFLDVLEDGAKSAERQKSCAYLAAVNKVSIDKIPVLTEQHRSSNENKLHIGYLSCDFHEHATMHLFEGVLRSHEKSDFKISAYSWAPVDDERTDKVRQYCDQYVDIKDLSDEEAARRIAADGVDILVDLKGYTRFFRLGIQARRPAPVVVSWLGFPGTLGHHRLADYIIGDPVVTPPDNAADFSETLALMPYCYQPNDSNRKIGPEITREEAGLPADAFVFSSFTSAHKLNPPTFDVWCRLLDEVPKSVLWLQSVHELIANNLKKEVECRGIDSSRVIFAPRMPLEDHLGRMQLADLALDTFPYTSHTTGSDALWAGVPLIALKGHTFVSRVSSSLLTAIGLEELITHSWQEYLALARELARDRERLGKIRAKLEANRKTAPLFDTVRFTRDLERLYLRIWEDHRTGKRETIQLSG